MNEEQQLRSSRTIHGAFERQASACPDTTALIHLQNVVTYRQLDERANHVASYLMGVGVRPGDMVALSLPHCENLIVAILAILKAGAAYLPLDPDNPKLRNRECLELAGVRVVIADHWADEDYPGVKLIRTTESSLFRTGLRDFASVDAKPDDPAYVLFTSGSTGTPKGVVVPHRAVLRLVLDTNYVSIDTRDTLLHFAPTSFDASTFEIWGALLNGARLVLYSGRGLDPNLLKRDILENSVSVLWLTAALFHIVADKFINMFEPLRVLLAGGDVLSPKYVNKVFDAFPKITIINGYGPTENTTFTCCHVMTTANRPSDDVPIGRPINGTRIHILDEELNEVEEGALGELYVSGPGVALGYLNGSEQDRFFRNSDIAPDLIYRTGDLVRQAADGALRFMGRRDNQVKVRGFRVSLEDVKNRIVGIPEVSDAVVVKESFETGDEMLVAYVKPEVGKEIASADIKRKLATAVPSYMIPERILIRRELAITGNGKLDRRACVTEAAVNQ